jgi:DNA-binding SARP family transcriptional activator/tetratricopeptide (TPR) repeat protein
LIFFGLLGPVTARVNGDEYPVAASRQRVVLAAMLTSPGRPLPAHELAELVWDGSPPAGAAGTLRTYVMRLRRTLGPEAGARIVTRAPGYLIDAAPGEVDTLRFTADCRDGVAALRAGCYAEASALLRQALGLWRGEPLADVPSQRLRDAEVPRLTEQRLQALHWRIDADLGRGRAADLIPELRTLLRQHPLREHFHAQLIAALIRCDQRAEALAAYRHARDTLVRELGIEPGAELRELRQRILSVGYRQPGHSGRISMVPRQLPAAASHFTGRAAELAELDRVLDRDPGVKTFAITGMAGVGKTALALRWAHQQAHRFPGGQLYANLRGFHPTETAATATEVIRDFLDAFGLPADQIPASLDAQAGLFRGLLSGRRALVILDNARDADQVRPLLPGDGASTVIVTSRNQLTGLVAEGAQPLGLDVLSAAEARELLCRRVGSDRITAGPRAAAELAAWCGGLPLALNIVAARAVAAGHLPLEDLAAQLTRWRLNEFDAGDDTTSVKSVFSWSYRALGVPAATAFRLLAAHPGPDISAAAAASLTGTPPLETRAALRELTRSHLLIERENHRFAYHDLLRAYACELAAARENATGFRAAAARSLDHYLHAAHRAALLVHPTKDPLLLPAPAPGVIIEELTDPAAALAWFEAEHRTLMAIIAQAADTGFARHAWQIPASMMDFFERRGHWHDEADALRTALTAARGLGDPHAEGRVHRYLARVYGTLGLLAEAEAQWADALRLYQRIGDQLAEAYTRLEVKWLDQQGRHEEVLAQASRALALFRACGHQSGVARALNGVGWCHAQLSHYEQAIECCQEALELLRESGDELGEAQTWDSLGYIYRQVGRHDESVACYQHPLETYLELKDRYHYATTLIHLGDTFRAAGREPSAHDAWTRAQDILNELHHGDAKLVAARLGCRAAPA